MNKKQKHVLRLVREAFSGSLANSVRRLFSRLFVGYLVVGVSALVASTPREERYVVVISLDGVPASALNDPTLPLPTLQRLSAEGVVAAGFHIANPTITWPSHTAMVTGVGADRHHVVFNGEIVRDRAKGTTTINELANKRKMVAAPTLYDIAHEQRLKTAALNWPCTLGSDSLDDNFPDVPDGSKVKLATPQLRRDMIARGILQNESDTIYNSLGMAARDDTLVRAACFLLSTRPPHLLLLHLENTDTTMHVYSVGSVADKSARLLADMEVNRVVEVLHATGLWEKTTIFVVSDHGFENRFKLLNISGLLRDLGWHEVKKSMPSHGRASVIGAGGFAMIFIDGSNDIAGDRALLAAELKMHTEFSGVFQPDEYAAIGWPTPKDDSNLPDLLVAPSDGFAISYGAGNTTGPFLAKYEVNNGFHGFLNNDPRMEGIFIAAGHRIKKGLKIATVRNIDLGPTIAHILGLRMANVDGQVLSEALAE